MSSNSLLGIKATSHQPSKCGLTKDSHFQVSQLKTGACVCSVTSNSSVTPSTLSCQAPLSMGFSRQESWTGLPFPPPGDLPDPGMEPVSPALAGRCFSTEPPGKPRSATLTHLQTRLWSRVTRLYKGAGVWAGLVLS